MIVVGKKDGCSPKQREGVSLVFSSTTTPRSDVELGVLTNHGGIHLQHVGIKSFDDQIANRMTMEYPYERSTWAKTVPTIFQNVKGQRTQAKGHIEVLWPPLCRLQWSTARPYQHRTSKQSIDPAQVPGCLCSPFSSVVPSWKIWVGLEEDYTAGDLVDQSVRQSVRHSYRLGCGSARRLGQSRVIETCLVIAIELCVHL